MSQQQRPAPKPMLTGEQLRDRKRSLLLAEAEFYERTSAEHLDYAARLRKSAEAFAEAPEGE